MVCIEEVIVRVAERKLVCHGRYLVLAVVVPPQLVVGEGLYEFSLRLDGSAWQLVKWSARAGLAQGLCESRRRTHDEKVPLGQSLPAGNGVEHGAPHVLLWLAILALGAARGSRVG